MATMKINIEKLTQYLKEDKILEFNSDEECMNYFNTYDYQNFKTVEEMKKNIKINMDLILGKRDTMLITMKLLMFGVVS